MRHKLVLDIPRTSAALDLLPPYIAPFKHQNAKRPKRFASPAFERPYLYHHPIRPAVIVRLQLSGISVAEAAAASACLDGPAELLCSAPVPLKAAD